MWCSFKYLELLIQALIQLKYSCHITTPRRIHLDRQLYRNYIFF